MENIIGKNLGKYHVIEKLGEGGMANVYRAFDTHLERDVAVKVILPSREASENFLKRFEREARTLAKLLHPNIVQVIDYGHYESLPYLVMPFVPGGTMKKYLGEPVDYQQAARLLVPVARALHYAHQQGIIHRDVKPANILITTSNEPMLSDFGVAKMIESDTHLTGTGLGIGTPDYMPPEQWSGKALPQTDQYALGIILYELVTGRRPYVADTAPAVMFKHLQEPLPRPSDFANVPEKVEKVLYKALAKAPEDRYADMAAFARALENLISDEVQPVHSGLRKRGKQKTAPAARAQVEAETIDELDTSAVQPLSPASPGKGVWFIIGIAVIAMIGAGIYFGFLRKNQNPPVAVEPAPIVQTKATTEEIVAQESTQPASPSSKPNEKTSPTPTKTPPDFAIQDIPLYDDFENGPSEKWYIADWSNLEDYQISGNNGKLQILVTGEQWSTRKTLYYYINDPKPVKAFFAKIRIKSIKPDTWISLHYEDFNTIWYRYAINEYKMYLEGQKINWQGLFDQVIGKDIWIGVYVQDGTAHYYLNERLLGKSEINGRIRNNMIGFEISSATSGGLTDLEIDEVRILFDE